MDWRALYIQRAVTDDAIRDSQRRLQETGCPDRRAGHQARLRAWQLYDEELQQLEQQAAEVQHGADLGFDLAAVGTAPYGQRHGDAFTASPFRPPVPFTPGVTTCVAQSCSSFGTALRSSAASSDASRAAGAVRWRTPSRIVR